MPPEYHGRRLGRRPPGFLFASFFILMPKSLLLAALAALLLPALRAQA